MENLWGILARNIFRTEDDLKKAILKAWDQIPIDQPETLVKSMPSRIFEIIQLNGAETKY
jgi:hypothetical protein